MICMAGISQKWSAGIKLNCHSHGSDGKESACNAGYSSLIPRSGRSLGEGEGHSNILAWRIPWIEETGRLQSKGLQRTGHD